MSEKQTRVSFTDLDRRKICEIQKKNPGWTQDEVTNAAAKELQKPLKRSSVTGILKDKAKWLKVEDSSGSRKHHKEAKWAPLETALYEWIGQVSRIPAALQTST